MSTTSTRPATRTDRSPAGEDRVSSLPSSGSLNDRLGMLEGALPVTFLPVRMETRFVRSGKTLELRVRLFPEELHVDAHERALTSDERAWGEAFIERTDGRPDEERTSAFAELTERFGARRAAWILHALERADAPPDREPGTASVAHTTLMPDRWLIVGYDRSLMGSKRYEERFRVAGVAIPPTLNVGLDPNAERDLQASDDVVVDAGIRWMVDFDEAERLGMAVRIDVTGYDKRRLPLLLAVGVKASVRDARELLERQFEALRYTTGLGFLAQATPTNNTDETTSGYSSADVRRTEVRAQAGQARAVSSSSNAGRLARALGLGAATFAEAERGGEDDHRGCSAMNRVLWPATFGYFLERMVYSTIFRPEDVGHHDWKPLWEAGRAAAQRLFRDHVRARGPLPTLRIGNLPYGVLPVSTLNDFHWQPRDASEQDDAAVKRLLLRAHEASYRRVNLSQIPAIGGGPDPEKTLLDVLSLSAVPERFGSQQLLTSGFLSVLANLHQEWSVGSIVRAVHDETDAVLEELGADRELLRRRSFEGRGRLLSAAYHTDQEALELPLVQPDPLSAESPLLDNYLRRIHESALIALRDAPGERTPESLLHHLVRHSKLSAYARAIRRAQTDLVLTYHDTDTYGLHTDTTHNAWTASAETHPESGLSYAAHYERASATGTHDDPDLIDFDTALQELAELPSEALDLLARETLATTSHRIDAWSTAFATKRLETLRREGKEGTHVGAFGWVFDLKVPSLEEAAVIGDPTAPAGGAATDTGGYVHAPSIDQARTAALLMSGHQARAATDSDNAFDMDLSSERVRLARTLLEGVRAGQSLGELLGYRFERELRERRLAAFVPAFRRAFPLPAGATAGAGEDTGELPAVLAESRPVDGVQLVRRLQRHADHPGSGHWLPLGELPPETELHAALQAAGEATRRALDATGDAVLAESVFQSLRGNPVRAGATLDAISRGELPPPELESQRTPRQGALINHRLVVPLAPAGAASTRPRGRAAPELAAFCRRLLGDPARARFDAVYSATDGAASSGATLTLAPLALEAIDLVYLAANEPDGESDLERLMRHLARAERPAAVDADAPVELVLEPRDLAEDEIDAATVLELASALHALIGNARPLSDADLLPAASAGSASVDHQALADQADAAVDALREAHRRLLDAAEAGDDPSTASALTDALLALNAFGIPGSVPALPPSGAAGNDHLLEQADRVAEAVAGRLSAVDALRPDGAGPSGDEDVLTRDTRRLQLVFGESFVVTPRFRPSEAAAIAAGFSAQRTLLEDRVQAPERMLVQLARVRPAVERLQRLRDYVDALQPDSPVPLRVAQLPFEGESTRWNGLPGRPEVAEGALSLTGFGADTFAADGPVAGLLIDAWTERVPAAMQTTGVAFNYNAPNTEPPHAILLVAPGQPDTPWHEGELLDALAELAAVMPNRARFSHALNGLGHLFPATFLAWNTGNDTVSTDLSAHLG